MKIVKLSNMMRVLTADAISDPTKVEAQVRREMNARENGHIKMNAANKLTDEEKRKKKETKKLNDEKKGIGALCFKFVPFASTIATLSGLTYATTIESSISPTQFINQKCVITLNRMA